MTFSHLLCCCYFACKNVKYLIKHNSQLDWFIKTLQILTSLKLIKVTVEVEVSYHLGNYVVVLPQKIFDGRHWSTGNTGHQDVIWSVTSPIRGCDPYQSIQYSICVSTEQGNMQFFTPYKIYFHLPTLNALGISIHFFTRLKREDSECS